MGGDRGPRARPVPGRRGLAAHPPRVPSDFRLYRYLEGRGARWSGRSRIQFPPPVHGAARVKVVDDGAFCRVRARFWTEGSPEPTGWSIDARDASSGGPRPGTIAFGGRAGARRYADLTVLGAGGRVLLSEPFSDPSRLRAAWRYRSALADWRRPEPLRRPAARIVVHDPDLVIDMAASVSARPIVMARAHTEAGQPSLGALYTSTHLGRRYDHFAEGVRCITAGVGTSVVPSALRPPKSLMTARSGILGRAAAARALRGQLATVQGRGPGRREPERGEWIPSGRKLADSPGDGDPEGGSRR
jgi:hypothetical protein